MTIRLNAVYDDFHDFIGAITFLETGDEGGPAVSVGPTGLSRREKEVVAMLREGFSNRDIAEALYISLGTVKNHLLSLYRKTGVSNRMELLRLFDGVPRTE